MQEAASLWSGCSVARARTGSFHSSRSPMLSARSSLMTADHRGLGVDGSREARRAQRSWVRWLNRLVDAVHELSAGRRRDERREPVFRIAQIGDDRWVVERPGAVIEHAF